MNRPIHKSLPIYKTLEWVLKTSIFLKNTTSTYLLFNHSLHLYTDTRFLYNPRKTMEDIHFILKSYSKYTNH